MATAKARSQGPKTKITHAVKPQSAASKPVIVDAPIQSKPAETNHITAAAVAATVVATVTAATVTAATVTAATVTTNHVVLTDHKDNTHTNGVIAHAAEPVAVTATSTTDEQAKPVKQKRKNNAAANGIHISIARVRRYMDKRGLNNMVDTEICKLKEQANAINAIKARLDSGKMLVVDVHQPTADGVGSSVTSEREMTHAERSSLQEEWDVKSPELNSIESKIKALSSEKVRFSSEAPNVISIICNELVTELLSVGMTRALAVGKRVVQLEHVHTGDITNIPLYPLIKSLKSFVEMQKQLSPTSRMDFLEAIGNVAKLDAEKAESICKALGVDPKIYIVGSQPAAAQQQPVPIATDDDASGPSFVFYINQLRKEIITNPQTPQFSGMEVSPKVKNYISDLIIESIERLNPLSYMTATNMKNKTITGHAIMRTIEMLLIDGCEPTEDLKYNIGYQPDPELVKQENAKVEESKKLGHVYTPNLENLAKVIMYSAAHTVSYPTSKAEHVKQLVAEKLLLLEGLSDPVDVPAVV